MLSANEKRAYWMLSWFSGTSLISRIKAEVLFELHRWAAILLPTFHFDNRRAPGSSNFVDTVSIPPTIADEPCDEWNRTNIQTLGSLSLGGKKFSDEYCT